VIQKAAKDFAETGVYQPRAVRYRLVVLHNPYADLPLPVDFTDGAHDEQYGVVHDGTGWRYGPVAMGIRAWEVPM
jgi:hypothetical protein